MDKIEKGYRLWPLLYLEMKFHISCRYIILTIRSSTPAARTGTSKVVTGWSTTWQCPPVPGTGAGHPAAWTPVWPLPARSVRIVFVCYYWYCLLLSLLLLLLLIWPRFLEGMLHFKSNILVWILYGIDIKILFVSVIVIVVTIVVIINPRSSPSRPPTSGCSTCRTRRTRSLSSPSSPSTTPGCPSLWTSLVRSSVGTTETSWWSWGLSLRRAGNCSRLYTARRVWTRLSTWPSTSLRTSSNAGE